tara:strand:- start:596 stop:757 length:162 start_codon:yes stop_codon:yes gene_type:complete
MAANYALILKSNSTDIVFKIEATSLPEAKAKFIAMKQMSEEEFNKIFIVLKTK